MLDFLDILYVYFFFLSIFFPRPDENVRVHEEFPIIVRSIELRILDAKTK